MKNILFFCRYYYPHIGGVEKQVRNLSIHLIERGYKITVFTEKYVNNLKDEEFIDGVKVIRFRQIGIKYLGLLWIWWWIFRHRGIISESDIIHAHSVYIWYWPFRFIFFGKPSYVTFHGWEGVYPIPLKNIVVRMVDAFLANKNITISDYVEKYYHIKADKLMYTSVDLPENNRNRESKKKRKNLLYVGRLDEDTGLNAILKALAYLKHYNFNIDFCGDGSLRTEW